MYIVLYERYEKWMLMKIRKLLKAIHNQFENERENNKSSNLR